MRALILLLLIAIRAFSQVPSPTGTQANARKSDPDSRVSAAFSETAASGNVDSEQSRRITDYTAELATYTKALVYVGVFQILVFLAQAAIFGFTLMENRRLISATGSLARAAGRSADVARRTLEISQRASVGIVSIRLTSPHGRPRDDKDTLARSCIEITAKNMGATMAKYFHFEYSVGVEGLDGFITNPETIAGAPTDLQPGAAILKISRPIEELFPASRIGWGYAVQDRHLTVGGSFRYRDIFKRELKVHYSARIDPSRESGRGDIEFEVISILDSDVEAGRTAGSAAEGV